MFAALVLAVVLTAILAAQPVAAAEPEHIGSSHDGRAIEVECLASDEHDRDTPMVLLIGGIHTGTEAHTVTVVEELQELAEDGELEVPGAVRLCFLTVLNPDGLESGERTNAAGVDLNRNWPTDDWEAAAYHPMSGEVNGGSEPLSEPETRALDDFVASEQPIAVVTWHCCHPAVEANGHAYAAEWGRRYAEAADYEYLEEWHAYPVTGQLLDAMEVREIAAVDVELRTLDDTDLDGQRAGLEAMLEAVAAEVDAAESLAPLARVDRWHILRWEGPSTDVERVIRAIEQRTNDATGALFQWTEDDGALQHYIPGAPERVNTLREVEQGAMLIVVRKD